MLIITGDYQKLPVNTNPGESALFGVPPHDQKAMHVNKRDAATPCQYLDTARLSQGWTTPSLHNCLHSLLLVCPTPPSLLRSVPCLAPQHSVSSCPARCRLENELCSGNDCLSLPAPTPVLPPSPLPAPLRWCQPCCCWGLPQQLLHQARAVACFWKIGPVCDEENWHKTGDLRVFSHQVMFLSIGSLICRHCHTHTIITQLPKARYTAKCLCQS